MFGFFFGALCLAGMVYALRRPYAFAHRGGGWHRGWHGEHGRHGWQDGGGGGRGFGEPGRARRMLRWVYERLGTSPGQETVLADAADAVAGAFESLRGEWEHSRGDLARAFRSEVLTTQGARVHDVLDGRQRAALADFLERAPGRNRWNV